ncbi:hypothetical protein V6N12_013364 [Hibiscus sabdariffa]|uniref:RNase H type-1 domain-containing protein n=1 Tax=Hibiscus sabdariffa TaxID=183260 RepID=A0ABR2D6B6_9ROSI
MDETFDPGAFSSHNSRKHRRLDDDPPDDGETRPAGTILPPSYKDSLMKDNSTAIHDADDVFDEEEIEIQEGDVKRSLVDGIISIDFSNRVQSLAEKSLDQTLVVKLLGRRIGYSTLRTKICEIWKPKQAIRLMDIENDYFLVTFKLRSDYLRVLVEGPWTVFGHYLTVQQWTPEFSTSTPYPTKVMVWIRLPGLPEICPDMIPKSDRVAPDEVQAMMKSSDTSPPASDAPLNCNSDIVDSFGPWMLAERRPRRDARIQKAASASAPIQIQGIRRVYNFNIAFVLKLGYALVSDTESLWVRLLRQKYKMVDLCSVSISRTVSSPLWKALAAAWGDLRSSLAWSAGTGMMIHPLDDVWVPSIGPLRPHLLSNADASQIHSLFDFLDDYGKWDTRKLAALFNNAVIPYILSIHCPDPSDIPDRPFWSLNEKHSFDIKSAYSSLSASSWNDESHSWKTIWSLQNRFSMIFGTAILRKKSGVSYLLQVVMALSFMAILRTGCNSTWVAMIYTHLGVCLGQLSFFRLFGNCGKQGMTWFSMMLLLMLIYSYNVVCYGLVGAVSSPTCSTLEAAGTRLGMLNNGCAVLPGMGIGSVGGVFRADDGSWITGFNKTIGIGCPLQAELWAILLGLQLAWDNGFERLLIQSDSKNAIKRLTSMQVLFDPCSLIRAIVRMCHQGWATEFQWIPRDDNKPADMLAKLDNLPNYEITIFSQPPESLLPFLDFDMSHSL